MKKIICVLLCILFLPLFACAEGEEDWSLLEEIEDAVLLLDDGEMIIDEELMEQIAAETEINPAREDLINRIIDLGESLYNKANGRPQRAHYSSDIYVCKNFTVYLFRQNRDAFRMAAYPNTTLVIPNNQKAADCKPYAYGVEWQDISAEDGNPFYVAAEFRYDTSLSADENMELALEFMRQVQRGDYFQMSAKYYYGVGAHSAIMISDYDLETDTVHWMDSNMRGTKKDGIRYGYVQFDEEQSIQWWAEAFCQKTRGATLYRLRDDIIYAEDAQ